MTIKEEMAVDTSYCTEVKDSLVKLQAAESRISELEEKLKVACEYLERIEKGNSFPEDEVQRANVFTAREALAKIRGVEG